MSFQQVADVIADLKVKGSSKGVSRTAIKNALPDITAVRINLALKKAVAAGKLVQVKESYKLPATRKKAAAAPAKKAAPKKKATKKAAPKKKATKKAAPKKKATKKKAAAPKKKATKKKATKKKK